MAIVEAASCGLQVVSTRVGGIPEVLPANLIHLTDVSVDSLHKGLLITIQKLKRERRNLQFTAHSNHSTANGSPHKVESNGGPQLYDSSTTNNNHLSEAKANKAVLCPYECNEILRRLYNWNDITERTERVYQRVSKERDVSLGHKLNCYLNACIPFVLVASFSYLLLKLLDIIVPRKNIDIAINSRGIRAERSKKKNS